MSVVNKVGNYGDGETDVDDLIHSWAKIPIMSADPDDENDQQGILLKRDIMTLYDDYANISKNAGASRNCIKLGIVERVSSDPTGYFDGLAAYALGNDDDLNIVDVLKACNVANGSLIDVSTIFQNWYYVIMGTDTPVAGGAGKNNIFKEPVGTMPSYLAKRPPALLCRYGTSDTDMESIPSAASSARQMDMSSVRSSDYQQHNFIVRKPSWEHLPACANVVRHNDFDPNDPTSMSLPPVDKTGLISPDSAFFRNILGDNAAEDAPMSPSSQVSSAVRMSISSKDMDDDEFYSNLEEITNIISYTSFDDYGGRYDTTSPRRKVNPSKNGGGVVESVPIVSDSEPASSSELEKAEAASGDKMAIGIAGNGKMEAPSIAIPTNNGTDGCSTSGSAVGSAAPNVQRRKRRKLMDIVEVLSDGTKVSKTILTPKGIYKTPHGFRVQLNIEPIIDESGNQSASAKRGKFSRNAKNFEDAMWVYEVAILVSDCPSDAQTMLIRGNFESMLSMNWFNTTAAYMFNLTSNVKKLHSLKILSETEYKLAIATLDNVNTDDKTIPAQFLDLDPVSGANESNVAVNPIQPPTDTDGQVMPPAPPENTGATGDYLDPPDTVLRLDSFEYHLRDDAFGVLDEVTNT